jgi:hypothetical protein
MPHHLLNTGRVWIGQINIDETVRDIVVVGAICGWHRSSQRAFATLILAMAINER